MPITESNLSFLFLSITVLSTFLYEICIKSHQSDTTHIVIACILSWRNIFRVSECTRKNKIPFACSNLIKWIWADLLNNILWENEYKRYQKSFQSHNNFEFRWNLPHSFTFLSIRTSRNSRPDLCINSNLIVCIFIYFGILLLL